MKWSLNKSENFEHFHEQISLCETEDELGYVLDDVDDAFLAGYIDDEQYITLKDEAYKRDDTLYAKRFLNALLMNGGIR